MVVLVQKQVKQKSNKLINYKNDKLVSLFVK